MRYQCPSPRCGFVGMFGDFRTVDNGRWIAEGPRYGVVCPSCGEVCDRRKLIMVTGLSGRPRLARL